MSVKKMLMTYSMCVFLCEMEMMFLCYSTANFTVAGPDRHMHLHFRCTKCMIRNTVKQKSRAEQISSVVASQLS